MRKVNNVMDRIGTSWRAITEHLNPSPFLASRAAADATIPGGKGLAPT